MVAQWNDFEQFTFQICRRILQDRRAGYPGVIRLAADRLSCMLGWLKKGECHALLPLAQDIQSKMICVLQHLVDKRVDPYPNRNQGGSNETCDTQLTVAAASLPSPALAVKTYRPYGIIRITDFLVIVSNVILLPEVKILRLKPRLLAEIILHKSKSRHNRGRLFILTIENVFSRR